MDNKIEYEKIKALLLDLDGTLINTEKAFYNSFRDVLLNEYNVSITEEDYKKYELEQNEMLIKTLVKNNMLHSNNLRDKIMCKVYKDYENKFVEAIKEDEAKENFELLKKIKILKIKIALITTCRRNYINKLLDLHHLNDTFDFIVAREDVPPERLKPDPLAYVLALKELNLSEEFCLSIEDSKRGVDAALAANIPVIKVDNFTSIKYKCNKVVEEKSALTVLKKVYNKNLSNRKS